MMSWVFVGMVVLSVVSSAVNGRINAVSTAVLEQVKNAVTLTITLLGTMSFWSGVMKVAQASGLMEKISRALSAVLCLVFRGVERTSDAMQYLCMNVAANMLGLGNVATPMGIAAMKELHHCQGGGKTAGRHMIMLVVLNTASVQLLPTTIAMLRHQYGSNMPMDILPAVLLASMVSVVCGITAAKLCDVFSQHRHKEVQAVCR